MSETLSQTDPTDALAARLEPGETLSASAPGREPRLTICVPAFKDDASGLIEALGTTEGADRAALIVFDDGSQDTLLTHRHMASLRIYPGQYALVTAATNRGRATARNRLAALAMTDWLLFLDADMRPDSGHFLTRYGQAMLELDGPGLVVGGFTVARERRRATALHHAQSLASDCVDAATRATDPGRFVFTSNLLVHRAILETVRFDPGFTGWGWEDVDWGLRVAERYPVRHIDNTACHLGLISNHQLITRFANSGANYARLLERHPEATANLPLSRAIHALKVLPFRPFVAGLSRLLASDPVGLLPMPLRLLALKTLRAARYADAIRPKEKP